MAPAFRKNGRSSGLIARVPIAPNPARRSPLLQVINRFNNSICPSKLLVAVAGFAFVAGSTGAEARPPAGSAMDALNQAFFNLGWDEVECVEDCADAHPKDPDAFEACVEENCPIDTQLSLFMSAPPNPWELERGQGGFSDNEVEVLQVLIEWLVVLEKPLPAGMAAGFASLPGQRSRSFEPSRVEMYTLLSAEQLAHDPSPEMAAALFNGILRLAEQGTLAELSPMTRVGLLAVAAKVATDLEPEAGARLSAVVESHEDLTEDIARVLHLTAAPALELSE